MSYRKCKVKNEYFLCWPGVYIINLKKTWEKLLLAARAIVAIENPADVCVISSRNTGQVCNWSHFRSLCTLLKPGTDVSVLVSEVCKSKWAGVSLTPWGLKSYEWGLIVTWATILYLRCKLLQLMTSNFSFFGSTVESSAEVCLCHWCYHLPRSFHPWYLH